LQITEVPIEAEHTLTLETQTLRMTKETTQLDAVVVQDNPRASGRSTAAKVVGASHRRRQPRFAPHAGRRAAYNIYNRSRSPAAEP